MNFRNWLLIQETVEVTAGIRHNAGNLYTATYNIGGDEGEREFILMFTTSKDGGIHINFLGGDEGRGMPFAHILQKFVNDLCSTLGVVDTNQISWSAMDAPIHGRQTRDNKGIRDRLFRRYLSQIKTMVPQGCAKQDPVSAPAATPLQTVKQKGKYDDHPLRHLFKSDDAFASTFGD